MKLDSIRRREFLEASALAAASLAVPGSGLAAEKDEGLVRSSDAMGAAYSGGERSGAVRSCVLARLFPPHAFRRRLS